MTDIRDKLDSLGRQVCSQATTTFLSEEGYWVVDRPDEGDFVHSAPTYNAGLEELSLDEYKNSGGDASGFNSSYKVTRGGDVWNHVYTQFSWVETEFTKFGRGDVESLCALRDAVLVAAGKLRANIEWTALATDDDPAAALERTFSNSPPEELLLANGMDQLSQWTGSAADAFYDLYGEGGQYWVQRLCADYCLLEALAVSLEAKMQLVVATRSSVVEVGEATIDALQLVTGGGGGDPSVLLAILGGLATIAFTVAFPEAAIGAAILGATISVSTEVIKTLAATGADPGVPGASEVKIEGDTTESVLESFRGKMSEVADAYNTKEGEVATGLSNLYTAMLSPGEGGLTNRQQIFEITFRDSDDKPIGGSPFDGADDKGDIDDPDMLGGRTTEVDPEKLVIGAGEFVVASDHMLDVTTDIEDTSSLDVAAFYKEVTAGGSTYIDGIRSSWCDVRDLAQDIVAHNGQILAKTAQVLVWAAEDYEVTDGTTAGDLQDTIDGLESFPPSGNDHDISKPDATIPPNNGPDDPV